MSKRQLLVRPSRYQGASCFDDAFLLRNVSSFFLRADIRISTPHHYNNARSQANRDTLNVPPSESMVQLDFYDPTLRHCRFCRRVCPVICDGCSSIVPRNALIIYSPDIFFETHFTVAHLFISDFRVTFPYTKQNTGIFTRTCATCTVFRSGCPILQWSTLQLDCRHHLHSF